MPAYPGAVASFSTKFDLTDVIFAAHINALQEEMVSVQTILGTVPQGTETTVKARMLAAEVATAAVAGKFSAGSGRLPSASVAPSTGSGSSNLDVELQDVYSRLASLDSSVASLNTGITDEATARTAVNTRVTAEIARATAQENVVQANLDAYIATRLRMAQAAYLNAVQSIPYNTWTDIATNVVSSTYNPIGGTFMSGGRVYSIGPLGTYFLDCRATFSSNNTGLRGIRWVTAGGTVIGEYITEATLTNADYLACIAFTEKSNQAGYYFAAQVYHTALDGSNNPISLNLLANSGGAPCSLDASFVPS